MLIQKSYSQQEIAQYFNLNFNDKKHYKRNLTRILDKLGYQYQYSSKILYITQPPTTLTILKDLLINETTITYNDNLNFLCLLLILSDDDTFAEMPNNTKLLYLQQHYNINISLMTLLRYYKILIDNKLIYKEDALSCPWYTYYENGTKIQKKVETEEEYILRAKYYKYFNEQLQCNNNNFAAAREMAYQKFKCTFYTTKPLTFRLFVEEELQDRNNAVMALVKQSTEKIMQQGGGT